MRENQNIAHCSVCSEKTHCRFSHAYITHRLHSTDSKFHSFLSQNLPNNMGDLCKILIQSGRRFITHSPTISRYYSYGICCFAFLAFSVPKMQGVAAVLGEVEIFFHPKEIWHWFSWIVNLNMHPTLSQLKKAFS